MSTKEVYEVEIAADQIANKDQFEAARREAYGLKGDERLAHLGRLVSSTTLEGDLPLYDVVLEKLTHNPDADQQLDEAERRFEEVSDRVASLETSRKHTGLTYRIALNARGDVEGVSRIESVPVDKKAEGRAKQNAKKIGWGPKQNGSSFRGNVVDPDRIRRNDD